MYTLSFFKKTWAVIATALVVTLCVSMFLLKNAQAQTSSGNVTGDMWSSTMGRISLNCKTGGATGQNICATSSYGLNVVPNTSTQTGAISGYAWGTYIGWVSFNPSDVTSCGTGAPATINFTTGAFSGWARALVGTTASGWDGCISLSGSGYGVTYNSSSATNNITGYAWGSVNAGWMMFVNATLALSSSSIDLKANGQDALNLPPYGGSVVLSWTGTNIASTSCTASGAWTGSKVPPASGSDPAITLPSNATSAPATYQYNISCIGTNAMTVVDSVVVTVASGAGSTPFLSFKANNVPAGAVSSPGVVSVFAGDPVNFSWETTNIQQNSCVGQITGALDANWTTGTLDSSDTPPAHTYSISAITAVPTTRTYIMHGCLDYGNTALPDQAITIKILPSPICRVVSSSGKPDAVVVVPSGGLSKKPVDMGIIWENTKNAFFPATLSTPLTAGGGGGLSVTIKNATISTASSHATVEISSNSITAPVTIPIIINGTPSTGAPASSCMLGTIHLVAPNTCSDPCADPASLGGPQCIYNAQHPRGCTTKHAPWEEI